MISDCRSTDLILVNFYCRERDGPRPERVPAHPFLDLDRGSALAFDVHALRALCVLDGCAATDLWRELLWHEGADIWDRERRRGGVAQWLSANAAPPAQTVLIETEIKHT